MTPDGDRSTPGTVSGCSSVGRAADSKTAGPGFESCAVGAIVVAGVVLTPASLLGPSPYWLAWWPWRCITAPVWSDPTDVCGAAEGAAAHLWGLWVAADGLWSSGPFLRVAEASWPGEFRKDLVDPLHLLGIAPATWIGGGAGATLAWNALPVVSMSLGAVGGAWMGARLGLGVPSRALLAGLLACSPSFSGATVPVGRSEQLALAWSAIHVAALHRAIREGTAWSIVVGGLTLGLQALAGWRPLTFLLFLEVPLAAAWVRSWKGCRNAALVGVVGALIAFPMLAAHASVSPWWLEANPWPSPFDHQVDPSRLSALLTMDGAGDWSSDPTPNAGRVAAPGAGAGGAPGRPLLGFALWGCLWGSACAFDIWRQASAQRPSSWAVPPLRVIHGWPRLAPLALLPLAIGAARGLDGVRRSPVAIGVALLLGLAEGVLWAPVENGSIARIPPEAHGELPAGALLSLPLVSEAGPAGQGALDRALLHAHALGRPSSIAPSPYRPTVDALLGSLAWVGRPGPPVPCDAGLGARLALRVRAAWCCMSTHCLPAPPSEKRSTDPRTAGRPRPGQTAGSAGLCRPTNRSRGDVHAAAAGLRGQPYTR